MATNYQNFANISQAHQYWEMAGCGGLPSVGAMNQARNKSVWKGMNFKTRKQWTLTKHGPGSFTCEF